MKPNNTNIDLFDIYVAVILGELYHSFPGAVWLDPAWSTVIAPLLIQSGLVDGKLHDATNNLAICSKSMHWLHVNGYFLAEYDAISDSYEGALITGKGLDVLRARPASLDQTLGEQLAKFSQDIGKETSKTYILKLVQWLSTSLLP